MEESKELKRYINKSGKDLLIGEQSFGQGAIYQAKDEGEEKWLLSCEGVELYEENQPKEPESEPKVSE